MRIIALLNLKPGVTAADYEAWARSRDIPTVRSMPSVDDFTVLRTTGLLGGAGATPYAYVGIIEVADMEGFHTDIATEAMSAVTEEMKQWVDGDPVFIMTEEVGTV